MARPSPTAPPSTPRCISTRAIRRDCRACPSPPVMARNGGPSRGRRLDVQRLIQVAPPGIELFDQLDFPTPLPFLEKRFAMKGVVNAFMWLIPDKQLHAVFLGEALDLSVAVFPGAPPDVIGHADVQRTVLRAGH